MCRIMEAYGDRGGYKCGCISCDHLKIEEITILKWRNPLRFHKHFGRFCGDIVLFSKFWNWNFNLFRFFDWLIENVRRGKSSRRVSLCGESRWEQRIYQFNFQALREILGTLRSDERHHAFLYISFPSLHDYDVKMPNFTMYRGSTQATTKFPLSFWTWIWFLGIQL